MAEYYRRITLTPKEVIQAIDAYRRAVPDFMPAGEITAFTNEADGSIQIGVKMSYGRNVQEFALTYKPADFIPAVLKFCTENNIRLPESGKRSVQSQGGQISIIIVNET